MTTAAQLFATVKKQMEEAEVGKGGLKRVNIASWRGLSLEQKRELLELGPIILIGANEDALVEMKFEDYFALCPVTVTPLKKPRMKIFEGALFREVM